MKLSNEKIINSIQGLSEIAKKPLPVKVSYAIAKNISKIDAELKIYDKERAKLIEKYAEKDNKEKVKADKNGQIILKDFESWDKDIKELLAIENEVDIHKFKLSELEGHNMTPAELMLIDYMIEE
ncbi:hypothetical protein [Candidatus Clostridium stratigraminis]|uniref:Uncharacterized protein n=1 Tax=Candidatus Clostridium stratigraminis TaxID=3381661 RepID=A0ABW8SYK8_9CLOT